VPAQPIPPNVTLARVGQRPLFSALSLGGEAGVAQEFVDTLRIQPPRLDRPVMLLSGGNQQKVVLARWLRLKPNVIIFDEPTRGIDVGAKSEVYHLMRNLADSGVVVIIISSDMEEILGVSDRIAVMHEGRITGQMERNKFNEETIMRLAVGQAVERQPQ